MAQDEDTIAELTRQLANAVALYRAAQEECDRLRTENEELRTKLAATPQASVEEPRQK